MVVIFSEIDINAFIGFVLGFSGAFIIAIIQRKWAKNERINSDHKRALIELRDYIVQYQQQLDLFMKSAGIKMHTLDSAFASPRDEWRK